MFLDHLFIKYANFEYLEFEFYPHHVVVRVRNPQTRAYSLFVYLRPKNPSKGEETHVYWGLNKDFYKRETDF